MSQLPKPLFLIFFQIFAEVARKWMLTTYDCFNRNSFFDAIVLLRLG
jgi:hypothetical protein